MKIYKLSNCMGCLACYSACQKFAIFMLENDESFLFLQINDEKCVKRYVCKKVLHYNSTTLNFLFCEKK